MRKLRVLKHNFIEVCFTMNFLFTPNIVSLCFTKGSYQPSNELMLRFYAYFKQATQGPCKGARPAFWDLVSRAKYDAWKKLGDMSKQQAMTCYVDELHT